VPIKISRQLTGHQRTQASNRHLGLVLAFVAGAINAGGFLAVAQYTSHMTGVVSSMADNLVLGAFDLALAGLGGLVSFVVGAACSAIMINFSRRQKLQSEYALPLILEALFLLLFGLMGATLARLEGLFVPATIMLLCFIMGLQNAMVTKLSKAEIRTTHITGVVTDIGIELGKLVYWNQSCDLGKPKIVADRKRLVELSLLVACFFTGGVLGALGFKYLGYAATVPLALMLIVMGSVPMADDFLAWFRRARVGH
jgi:uncharacterized membrane protein YoaK (UPF0700 family)